MRDPGYVSAEVLVPCGAAFGPTLTFFTERLHFRVDAIFPADAPSVAVISGHGLRLRLESIDGPPPSIRLVCRDLEVAMAGLRGLVAPNGTRLELVLADMPVEIPPLRPAATLVHAGDSAAWHVGRAGMRYRDLIPDRQGGGFIASHIVIPDGGSVQDYVHFHKVRFQMIYCLRGWVRVVYEDQGPPFVMSAGDAVLQPPRIRHRVLECSPGLEVIEVGCPARHETLADHELSLPTARKRPSRKFDGQRFTRHVASEATWLATDEVGVEARDLGIAAATAGLATAQVLRAGSATTTRRPPTGDSLSLGFVLDGRVTLRLSGGDAEGLSTGDAWTVPPDRGFELLDPSADFQWLAVTVAAEPA